MDKIKPIVNYYFDSTNYIADIVDKITHAITKTKFTGNISKVINYELCLANAKSTKQLFACVVFRPSLINIMQNTFLIVEVISIHGKHILCSE